MAFIYYRFEFQPPVVDDSFKMWLYGIPVEQLRKHLGLQSNPIPQHSTLNSQLSTDASSTSAATSPWRYARCRPNRFAGRPRTSRRQTSRLLVPELDNGKKKERLFLREIFSEIAKMICQCNVRSPITPPQARVRLLCRAASAVGSQCSHRI